MVQLPDIPDAPVNHRLRALTVLATAAVLLASVGADSYRGGPVAQRDHVFTHVRAFPGLAADVACACACVLRARVAERESARRMQA
jgi:hypothetical protein